MKSQVYPLLLSPIRIGKIEISNRLVMAPMGSEYSGKDGSVTNQLISYYARRAQGGVGLIMVEAAFVEQRGNTTMDHLGLDRDDLIPGFQKLTDAIHYYRAKVFLQLLHGGALSRTYLTGCRPVAPSLVPTRRSYEIPRELATSEIQGIVASFAEAARRAKEAGFDGVEIHACHHCLLSQFLSPAFNKRKDTYGGDVQGRVRILLEIIELCRAKTGKDYPITVRINGEEPYAKGNKLADAIQISLILQDAVDGLSITSPESINLVAGDKGKLVPLAAAIKARVRVPVAATGAILHPDFAEQILRDGMADMIVMGRPLLADPDLLNKAANNQLEDLRECTLCHMCRQRDIRPQINCMYNFEVGRESMEEYKITPAKQPKKVLIAGAGPGGMEAARVAALRGHQVTLCEQEQQVGGQLRLAGVVPTKNYINKVTEYLGKQITKLKVDVRLGTTVTQELVEKEKPYIVIIATGSIPKLLNCPIVDNKNELSNLVTAHDVLAGKAKVGKYVLVVGAGGVGAETAEVLAEQGKGVTLIDELPTIAADLEDSMRNLLLQRLTADDIVIYTSTRVKRIIGKEVILERAVPMFDPRVRLNEQMLEGIDTIVSAVGSTPNNTLAQEIRDIVPKIYVIGDAKGTRTALEAIHEGSRIGRLI